MKNKFGEYGKSSIIFSIISLFNGNTLFAEEASLDSKEKTSNILENKKDLTLLLSSNEEIYIEDESSLFMISEDPSFLSLYVDYGVSFLGKNNDSELNTELFSSRALSLSLAYNMVIPDSHFAITLGAGYLNSTLSFESEDNIFYALSREEDKNDTISVEAKTLLPTKRSIKEINGSYLNRHYIELILGGKFFADKLSPKDSFSFFLGFKFGILISSNIEIVYGQDQIAKTLRLTDNFNLKDLKIGATAKIAWRRFGVFYDIDFTDTFSTSIENNLQGPDMSLFQKVGLFIDLF